MDISKGVGDDQLSAQVGQESQMVGVQARAVPALVQKYGFQHGAQEIHWFEEHYGGGPGTRAARL